MKTEPWFFTYSGIKFDLLNPTQDMIDIEDIAHALSMQCRWNGHCKYFYSLAEHSYHTSYLVPEKLALHALLHDAAEAYCGDLITPLKDQLPNFKKIEHKILHLIFDCFGVQNSPEDKMQIKFADGRMIPTEAYQIIPNSESYEWLKDFPPRAQIDLEMWNPIISKGMFMNRFYEVVDWKQKLAS